MFYSYEEGIEALKKVTDEAGLRDVISKLSRVKKGLLLTHSIEFG